MNLLKVGFSAYNAANPNIKNNKDFKLNYSTDTIHSSNNYEIPHLTANYMSNITFRGQFDWGKIAEYSKDMGKRIYSKRHVTNLAKIHKDANGITEGRGLPDAWIGRIQDTEKFDKDNFITAFGEIFAQERVYADVDKLQKNLTDLFRKHNIIDEKTPLSVKYIGHGFQAWAYRINIEGDSGNGIVIKLFKRNNNFLQNHGNHTEQNLAEYIKNYAGDSTEFVKYYYGDVKHGLMTSDYLPPTIEPPKNRIDLTDIGIGYGDDFPKNRVNGWICDFGGITTVSNLVGNKSAQDVHSAIKYAKTAEEKISIFNKIISQNDGSDEFKDKAIGLVHSIKHLPKEMQPDLYNKCFDLGSHRVNIALIQDIKNFKKFPELFPLIEKLVTNVDDIKAKENIAKEIQHIPDKLRHKFFEEEINTNHSAVIKYLARNINQYYKNMLNRFNIYSAFADNADSYASVALINSMHYMGSSRYGEYFEKFYAKNDEMVNTALARSIDLLNENPRLQRQWIDKLAVCDSNNVKAGLAEVIPFIKEEQRAPLYRKLLESKDKVTKEFLAESILSLPKNALSDELVVGLLDGADNMVRGALVNAIKKMPEGKLKDGWKKLVIDDADNSIKLMVENLNV